MSVQRKEGEWLQFRESNTGVRARVPGRSRRNWVSYLSGWYFSWKRKRKTFVRC